MKSMSSPLCDQSQLPSSQPLIKRAVTVSCCPFLPCPRLSCICLCFLVICMCVSVFVGHFASLPRRPQVFHLQYLMWAPIRREVLSNMLATYWLRSHTQPHPPLIFHGKEERDAYIILTEPEWRETSLCYLHTHMHCQRFIVQGFNGALTPLSLSLPVFLSPHSRTHIHPSFSFLFLFSSSVFPLSAVHLLLFFISFLHYTFSRSSSSFPSLTKPFPMSLPSLS